MTEAKEQAVFVEWFRLTYPDHAHLSRVSMSGINLPGPKAARMVNMMRSQGIHPGESDIMIAAPGSLFVEHKAEYGTHKLTLDQQIYLDRHGQVGNYALCTRGLNALKETVEQYMRNTWGQ